MAAFIACATFTSRRYFIGLQKSRLVPSTAVSFLGFICDSEKHVFLLPQGKRTEFAALEKLFWVIRQSLWRTSKVRGENHLLCLLVSAAKLFTNSTRQAISRGVKSANNKLLISTELRDELIHWGFLGSWERFPPSKCASHIHLTLHSDASFCGWGGRLTPWASAANLSQWKKLRSSYNARVDAFVDNKVLLHSWERQVSRSPANSDILKSIFSFTVAWDLSLNLIHVPSRKNLLALTLSIWRLFRLTCKSIALVVLSVSSLCSLVLARWECRCFFPRSFSLVRFWSFSASRNAPFAVLVPNLRPRTFWWPLVSMPNALSSWALKGIPTFYCSPPDLATLRGINTLYSGIFGWFGSPPFEIALFALLGLERSPRPCTSCAKGDPGLLVFILPFVSLA